MLRKRFLLPFLLLIGCLSSVLSAAESGDPQDGGRYQETLNERDFDSLREFIKTKREIPLEEKDEDMSISVDVRTEWRHLTETAKGKNLRGGNATKKGVPISRNDWDIEMNLRFDYRTERTWVVAHAQWDNSAGVDDNDVACELDPHGYHGSGACDDICLKKAYFGYLICDDGRSRLEFEMGRRNLYNAFTSQIQFLSRFDGMLLKYKSKICGVGDWYWTVAGFLVDERVNHLAWVTEIGLLNICDTGFNLRYSYIDWCPQCRNRCLVENKVTKTIHKASAWAYKSRNSQITVNYVFTPECLAKEVDVFGAYMINHLGYKAKWYKKDENGVAHLTTAKNQNTGWYVGFNVGEVDKEGDWSFEMMYQWVQAFAAPDEDFSGIGRGNVLNQSVTAFNSDGNGNGNYKGWVFEALYALTDNITIDTILEFSQACNTKIGGAHNFSKFEVETIYAF